MRWTFKTEGLIRQYGDKAAIHVYVLLRHLSTEPKFSTLSLWTRNSNILSMPSLVTAFHRLSNKFLTEDILRSILGFEYHIQGQLSPGNTVNSSYEHYLINAWNFAFYSRENPWQVKCWMICFFFCIIYHIDFTGNIHHPPHWAKRTVAQGRI